MNLVTIGMFRPNIQGIGGSIPPMSSHGPVPPALFLCVGAGRCLLSESYQRDGVFFLSIYHLF
ncbi:hypothetical protein MKW92_032536 [Papaver armeniacum]|nr:hypothetical protein MKW92_032536 [Papaver armeniacum]